MSRTASVEASSFISNQATYGGGAFFQKAIVQKSTFEGNKATGVSLAGGGALIAYVQATLQNNTFVRNTASTGGAVQFLFFPPDASSDVSRITNNLWIDNAARDGAAIALGLAAPGLQGDHTLISHNTIVRQTGNNDSALYMVKSPADITNNIITQHRTGIHASNSAVVGDANLFHAVAINYLGINNGPNDLTAEPLFVDPANHDYHLQPGSPAQDSALDGEVALDLDGVSRPQGEGSDRGAFEVVYVNHAPLAQPDVYTTALDITLVVTAPGVLDNDSDTNGDAITATVATAPAHGEVALQPTGAFIYTPAVGFTGMDSFTYQASDGVAASPVVTVALTVTGAPPVQPVAIRGLQASHDGPVAKGRTIHFAATVEAGSNILFAWDFGDGTTLQGATASHVYAEPGEYTVTLDASNSLGAEQATTTVTVLLDTTVQHQIFSPFVVR